MKGTLLSNDNLEPMRPDIRGAVSHMRLAKRDPHGDAEGVVRHPAELDKHNHSSTVILCKDIADLLVRRYPGWAWAVQPQENGRIINVWNLHLSSVYGFTIRMVDVMNDPRRRLGIRAGHEILRRFKMPDRMNPEKLQEAPRDVKGNCIPDISDFDDRKEKRRNLIALAIAEGRADVITTPEGEKILKIRPH